MVKPALIFILLAAIFLLNDTGNAQTIDTTSITPVFEGYKAACVIYDLNNHHYWKHNPQRCNKRFPPMSTYKVPHSLFALDAGVLDNKNSTIRWDSIAHPQRERWPEAWANDHTLQSAIANSVVWYYQEIAQRIGRKKMQYYVDVIGYGNRRIEGDITLFWFDPLQISANEQIAFLQRLKSGKLPFNNEHMAVVKNSIRQPDTPNVIYAKTGGGNTGPDKFIGWWVGWAEKGENVYFFATNVEGRTFKEVARLRTELTRKALLQLGIITE